MVVFAPLRAVHYRVRRVRKPGDFVFLKQLKQRLSHNLGCKMLVYNFVQQTMAPLSNCSVATSPLPRFGPRSSTLQLNLEKCESIYNIRRGFQLECVEKKWVHVNNHLPCSQGQSNLSQTYTHDFPYYFWNYLKSNCTCERARDRGWINYYYYYFVLLFLPTTDAAEERGRTRMERKLTTTTTTILKNIYIAALLLLHYNTSTRGNERRGERRRSSFLSFLFRFLSFFLSFLFRFLSFFLF